MCERPILPQISQIIADKTQNHKTALTTPNCLSLRNNAACCIPLRDLRDLRENTHPNLLNLSAQKKPQCLPQISLIYADKTQNHINPTNCLSLRNNAALLHSSAWSAWSAGEYSHKSTQSIYTEETPMSPADFADLRRQTTITTKQPLPQTNCLSLRDNAACCIPLRYLRNLRENNTQEDSINPHKRNPSVSRRSRRFTQTNHKTTKQP